MVLKYLPSAITVAACSRSCACLLSSTLLLFPLQARAQPGTVAGPVLCRRERRRQLALAAQVGRVGLMQHGLILALAIGRSGAVLLPRMQRQHMRHQRQGCCAFLPSRHAHTSPACLSCPLSAASGRGGLPAAACWARWRPRPLNGAWRWCRRPSSAPTPCRCAQWTVLGVHWESLLCGGCTEPP